MYVIVEAINGNLDEIVRRKPGEVNKQERMPLKLTLTL